MSEEDGLGLRCQLCPGEPVWAPLGHPRSVSGPPASGAQVRWVCQTRGSTLLSDTE